jgi:hypothetical protein
VKETGAIPRGANITAMLAGRPKHDEAPRDAFQFWQIDQTIGSALFCLNANPAGIKCFHVTPTHN